MGIIRKIIDEEMKEKRFNMKLLEGNLYYGFLLEKITELTDIKGRGHLFLHQKSGARLFYIKSEDPNKVFFISFKTPPENDCGTAHIIEHSVLCGSQRYPVKDPFNELSKGSLNTYLNALTYSDKTMYPIASLNEKDFWNLCGVYLDAVFAPNIYQQEEIFMQEGWHYSWEKEQEPLRYKGVVFNEMKGALSDPERILYEAINKSLFPTSIYRFESGGDPEYIPKLSYKAFLDFHKKYYHPSNSFLYLYGNMDPIVYLKLFHEQYLNRYNLRNNKITIEKERAFEKNSTLTVYYPTAAANGNASYFSLNYVIGESTDAETILAFELLSYLLLGTNGSPLKNALLEAGIGEEVEGSFDSSSFEMVFSIIAKKCSEDQKKAFHDIVFATLKKLSQKGFDEKHLEASLNRWEFNLREEDYGYRPKGLVYGMKLMKSWLHEADPAESLKTWKYFDIIREESRHGYFEKLITEKLLDNSHSSIVCAYPKLGLQQEIDEKERQELEEKRNSLTEKEKEKLLAKNKALKDYQNTKDSPEALATIPILKLSEITKDVMYHSSYEEKGLGGKALFTPLDSNGIVYAEALFNLRAVPENLLQYAGLLAELLGRIGTKTYSYYELPSECNLYTGGIYAGCKTYPRGSQKAVCCLSIKGRALEKNCGKLFHLLSEILMKSVLKDTDKLTSVILEIKSEWENHLTLSGHVAAITGARALFEEASYIKYQTGGIGFVHFLEELLPYLQKEPGLVAERLETVCKYLFNRDNVTVCFAGTASSFQKAKGEISRFFDSLYQNKTDIKAYSFVPSIKSIGFTSASKVQYNAIAASYQTDGQAYSGAMQVVETIVDSEYLWNKVRVEGGAYSCGSGLLRGGSVYAYSYRDPNIQETLEQFRNIGRFLSELSLSDRELTRFLIGAVNKLDRPKTIREQADQAITRAIVGVTKEVLQKERQELLLTNCKTIQAYGSLFEKAFSNGFFCTVGNEGKIQESKAIYQKILPLFPKR